MVSKNGYKFEIKVEETDVDKERSHEVSNYNGYETAVVRFNVTVTEVTTQERFNYELVGNIEYTQDGAELEFFDGSQYRSYLTLVGGDEQDREFNGAVKDFFAEDCDFASFIHDNLSDDELDDIGELIK